MSGALDEDTRRTLSSGRQTLGAMLQSAQKDLQKVFIAFVVALVGTIWILRMYVWDKLKADMFARMPPGVRGETSVIAVTPFDVILLQAKIGLIVGAIVAVPLLLYYSRDALRERGIWPRSPIARWKLLALAMGMAILFLAGITYAYVIFFPIMFDFLASNAIDSGFQPTYHIVKWMQFVLLLSLSFGIAAELPLVMTSLAYSEIIPYETFRDKWKIAVIILYGGGALFTPPDPITQLMWATPLVGLYAVSLRLTKIIVGIRRSSEQVDLKGELIGRWNILLGGAILSFTLVFAFTPGVIQAINAGLEAIPYTGATLPTIGSMLGLSERVAKLLLAFASALVVTTGIAYRIVLGQVRELGAHTTRVDPTSIDFDDLDRAGVEAAPPEAFEALTEEEALSHASRAMDNDNPEKAEILLERFDEAAARMEAESEDGETPEGEPSGESGDVVTETTAGVVNAYTEEETTEDDIGGYYHDIAFILDSITSKAFHLVAVFGAVLIATFGYLYTGGIKTIKQNFVSHLPPSLADEVNLVNLHPVEHLIFEIKFSTLLGLVAVIPLLMYYAWPALKDRGWARGNRDTLLVWGGSLFVGILLGSYIGYRFIAPSVISWLAADALNAHMLVKYRINTFGWLVIFTTVGIGLLAEIPVSMVLFHRGGIVPFDIMYDRWRVVVVGIFAIASVFTPGDMFTMFMVAIPTSLAYLFGLGVLWVYTLGGRRTPSRKTEPAD